MGISNGYCVRFRPEYRNHVRSSDFVRTRTRDGRGLHILTMRDESTRCPAIDVDENSLMIGCCIA